MGENLKFECKNTEGGSKDSKLTGVFAYARPYCNGGSCSDLRHCKCEGEETLDRDFFGE